MAEIRVQPKKGSLAWLWVLLVLVIVAAVVWYLYFYNAAPTTTTTGAISAPSVATGLSIHFS